MTIASIFSEGQPIADVWVNVFPVLSECDRYGLPAATREDLARRICGSYRVHVRPWLTHDGGPCPVPPDTRVRIRIRAGNISKGLRAAGWAQGFNDWWRHEGDACTNIVAYQIIEATR